MNKLTKGAFAMVLVGSVTFSVTNALLAEHSSKQKTQSNAMAVSNHKKTTDDDIHHSNKQYALAKMSNPDVRNNLKKLNNAQKMGEEQITTMAVEDVQTTPLNNIVTLQSNINNNNESDIVIPAVQKVPSSISTSSTITPAAITRTNSQTTTTTNTYTTSSTMGTQNSNSTSTPAPPASPTSTNKTTTSTNQTTTTTAKTNHGSQVSQAAKEKAVSQQSTHANNGNKKGTL